MKLSNQILAALKKSAPVAGVVAATVASVASLAQIGPKDFAPAKLDNVSVVKAALEASIEATETMESAVEWHESKLSTPNVFAMLAEKKPVTSAELCSALNQLQPDGLAHFDAEIKQYKELVAPCFSKLSMKLANYWAMQSEFTAMMNPTTVASSNVDLFSRPVAMNNSQGVRYPVPNQGIRAGEFALTFDDGPSLDTTDAVLDTLKRYNAKSTFFVVGNRVNAAGADRIMKRIAADGHSIANHSYWHKGMKTLLRTQGPEAVKWEIQQTQKSIYKAFGFADPFFRFPGGTDNEGLLSLTRAWKLAVFHWDMDSKDFETPSPNEVVRKTIQQMERKGGGIFLFHDVKEQTRIALPHILEWMAKKGYKTVTLVPEKMSDRKDQPLLK